MNNLFMMLKMWYDSSLGINLILGFHDSEDHSAVLLGFVTKQTCQQMPAFWRNTVSPLRAADGDSMFL
jgi:hypothetical protein